jgi:hypothetical protein
MSERDICDLIPFQLELHQLVFYTLCDILEHILYRLKLQDISNNHILELLYCHSTIFGRAFLVRA